MNDNRLMDAEGWEAFVHGVFAITITLLVLDIRVPAIESTPTAPALVDALVAGWPRYVAYVLSFLFVGIYWFATHRSFRMMEGVDQVAVAVGLMYLMVIALVPFVAKLLAEYVGADQGRDRVGVVVFIGWQLVVTALSSVLLLHASRAGLWRRGLSPADTRSWVRLSVVGCSFWVVAAVAALIVGTAALVLPGVLLLIYLWAGPVSVGGRERRGGPEG